MNSQQSPKAKPSGLKRGCKKIGKEREGVVKKQDSLYPDKAERLEQEGQGQGWLVRAAVDQLIAQLDKQKKPHP